MEAIAQLLLGAVVAAVGSALAPRGVISTDTDQGPSAGGADIATSIVDDVYNPSVQDILEVKEIIQEASGMPLELLDAIIDFAEYWACSTIKTLSRKVAQGNREPEGNILVLRSLPLGYAPTCGYLNTENNRVYQCKAAKPLFPASDLSFLEPDTTSVLEQWAEHTRPRGKNPCRKIVFTIRSRDQGWGGNPEYHGTYQGSYTWFDVGLERFTALNCGVGVPTDAMPHVANEGIDPASPAGRRVEWLLSSTPLTGAEPSTAWGNTVPVEPSDSGRINPPSNAPPLLRYNLLTIIPKTLGDLGHLSLDHPFLPPAARLQTNVMARAENKTHIITWSFDDDVKADSAEGDKLEQQGRGRESMTGEFVRSLKLGDVVTVWARARFPGWKNRVEQVKMDIFWAT